MYKHQITDAANRVPRPANSWAMRERPQSPRSEHDVLTRNGHDEIRTGKTRKECEIRECKWRGYEPVEVAKPQDLSDIHLVSVGDVFVGLRKLFARPSDPCSGREGEIGYKRDRRYQGKKGVEDAFRLKKPGPLAQNQKKKKKKKRKKEKEKEKEKRQYQSNPGCKNIEAQSCQSHENRNDPEVYHLSPFSSILDGFPPTTMFACQQSASAGRLDHIREQ